MNRETLKNIVNGDQDAYSKLYIEYFRKFYNYGKKFTTDEDLIEDSIQEVFLDFWTKKQKLLEVGVLNGYFFSSFRYILLKKIKHSNKIIRSDEFETEPEFSIDHFIIRKEVDEELRIKLRLALQRLTAHQREAVFLRFYEGLPYEEVAATLNVTVKATYKIIARSLSILKDNMFISVSALLFILR